MFERTSAATCVRKFVAARVLVFEKARVAGYKTLPFRRNIRFKKDCGYGTNRLARATVRASLGIDVHLFFVRAALNAIDGTDIYAS